MNLIDKIKESISKGVRIDVQVDNSIFKQGDLIIGEARVIAGEIPCTVSDVSIGLFTKYELKEGTHAVSQNSRLASVKIDLDRTLQPNEEVKIPFSMSIPQDAPVSIGRSNFWIHASAEVESAVDPYDNEYILIKPSEGLENVINAFQLIGFVMEAHQAIFRHGKSVSKFEFYPYRSDFKGKIEEVEMCYVVEDDCVCFELEIDPKLRTKGDEIKVNVSLTASELQDVMTIKDKLVKKVRECC